MCRFRSHGFVVAPISIRQGPEVALDMVNMCVLSTFWFRFFLTRRVCRYASFWKAVRA